MREKENTAEMTSTTEEDMGRQRRCSTIEERDTAEKAASKGRFSYTEIYNYLSAEDVAVVATFSLQSPAHQQLL